MNDSEKTTGSLALKPKPQIITIPATGQDLTRPLRVAAYARVSSDSNDQLHSYAAQTAYFARLINSNPNWIFADIYADQGITGTSVEKRDDFLRMMEDCRSGRIDRILVKSTSRFARNTKESLEAVRELKSLGVSVYFEEQNIDTAQATGETLTAVFSALAQKRVKPSQSGCVTAIRCGCSAVSSLPAAPPTATGWSITNWKSSRTRPLSSGRSLTATSPASAWRISQKRSRRGVSLPSKIPPSGRFAVSSTFCEMKIHRKLTGTKDLCHSHSPPPEEGE